MMLNTSDSITYTWNAADYPIMTATNSSGSFTFSASTFPVCLGGGGSGSRTTKEKTKKPNLEDHLPHIRKISHPNNTTVVHWDDDTTTSVRLMSGETYDKYAAFCACVVKKIYGSTTRAKKVCDKYDYEAMQAKERELREKEEEKLRVKAKRRLKARIKRRARELYIEEEARKLAVEKTTAESEK